MSAYMNVNNACGLPRGLPRRRSRCNTLSVNESVNDECEQRGPATNPAILRFILRNNEEVHRGGK